VESLREKTINLIVKIYDKYPRGGALHIVLDDGNTEDRNIYWCIENSIRELSADKEIFEECAISLMKLGSERKRNNAIRDAWNRIVARNQD